jgi:hypothetical protein
LAQERDGKDAERVLRSTFVAAWADRPIGDITALYAGGPAKAT